MICHKTQTTNQPTSYLPTTQRGSAPEKLLKRNWKYFVEHHGDVKYFSLYFWYFQHNFSILESSSKTGSVREKMPGTAPKNYAKKKTEYEARERIETIRKTIWLLSTCLLRNVYKLILRYFNPSGVILWLQVTESRTLYVLVYISCIVSNTISSKNA